MLFLPLCNNCIFFGLSITKQNGVNKINGAKIASGTICSSLAKGVEEASKMGSTKINIKMEKEINI